ncbi:hypothetical protein [Actinomadura sp. 21ATH]|uniref:NucA/NucB deoxyribonuclease domain-containing protein n=1 Tax=Actinomadura sp. 21ATH TaxID=1735444 RepID=UPI0035BFF0F5
MGNIWTNVGWIDVTTYNALSISIVSGNWTLQQQIDSWNYWGETAGATAQGVFGCSGVCTLGTNRYPPQAMTLANTPEGLANYQSTATAPGAVGNADSWFTVTFQKPGYTPSLPYTQWTPEIRCDNDVPGHTIPGCVNDWYHPAMIYTRTGPYPQLARHIKAAQDSGLPGAYNSGEWLNRITGPDVVRNRNRSCPTGDSPYPRPAGHSCDEYPFASTKQGAMTANPDIPPRDLRRTFDWCQMPIIVPTDRTGPTGYSICMIDENQNSNGGTALDRFYIENRVLAEIVDVRPGDKFDVWIQ